MSTVATMSFGPARPTRLWAGLVLLLGVGCTCGSSGDAPDSAVDGDPALAPGQAEEPNPGSEEPTIIELPPTSSIDGLVWAADGERVITGGDELSIWSGDPLQRGTVVELEEAVDELAASERGVSAKCSPTTLCVYDTQDLSVRHRLECPRLEGEDDDRVPEGARWAPGGVWIAARCARERETGMGPAVDVTTCIWDGRTGERVRCVRGLREGGYQQPFAFRSGTSTLAVSSEGGFDVLEPPEFETRVRVEDGPGMMLYRAIAGWTAEGELVVATEAGVGVHHPGEEDARARFDVGGMLVDGAVAPTQRLLAMLYRESLIVHRLDGETAAEEELRNEGGTVAWSHEGGLLAVDWRLGQQEGLLVYRVAPRTLTRVFSAHRSSGEGRVAFAWHPSEPRLAYAAGDSVRVVRVGETPTQRGRRE